MRKFNSLLMLVFICLNSVHGSMTFKVEELSKPSRLLDRFAYDNVFKQLIDAKIQTNDSRPNQNPISYNIVAHNKGVDSLVNYGQHSFFEGMYKAYADHRPFVLSPDMMWLLISQGFAQHVNNNAEALRKYFVQHDGKMTLVVVSGSVTIDNPNSPWETVFPEFTQQIDAIVGKDLVKTLTCDFSTTTIISRVASQITIMEAMKSYFEYLLIYFSCGIPEITLEGTPEDWQKVLDKTNQLKKYELGWWVDELVPVLEKIVQTSKGNMDNAFWRAMFIQPKENPIAGGCGGPTIIDGWIVKFYPYDKDGKRNNLKVLNSSSNLPPEVVCVDLIYQELNLKGEIVKTVPLELWAGFIGLNQESKSFTLKPEIGWMVRKKDNENDETIQGVKKAIAANASSIKIRVKTIPKELFILKDIDRLSVTFIDDIQIPQEFVDMRINTLYLTGKISETEIETLMDRLKNVKILYINGHQYK